MKKLPIYQAILAAADRIEADPDLFVFMSTKKPGCRTPGCALGWIAFYARAWKGRRTMAGMSKPLLGIAEHKFYLRLARLEPSLGYPSYRWTISADICASVLRSYATVYKTELEALR